MNHASDFTDRHGARFKIMEGTLGAPSAHRGALGRTWAHLECTQGAQVRTLCAEVRTLSAQVRTLSAEVRTFSGQGVLLGAQGTTFSAKGALKVR